MTAPQTPMQALARVLREWGMDVWRLHYNTRSGLLRITAQDGTVVVLQLNDGGHQ